MILFGERVPDAEDCIPGHWRLCLLRCLGHQLTQPARAAASHRNVMPRVQAIKARGLIV